MKNILCLLILSGLILFSCENPSGSDSDSSSTLTFTATSQTEASGSVIPRFQTLRATSESLTVSELDTYYQSLGSLIDFSGSTTLSPTNFVLTMSTPYIGGIIDGGVKEISFTDPKNELSDVEEIEELIHVDYVLDYPFEVTSEVIAGTYDSVFMFMTSSARDLYVNDFPDPIFEDPHVIVTVPGYTDIEWPDKSTTLDGKIIYQRQYLGNNSFRFELKELLPDTGSLPIEYYMFSSEYTVPAIVIPGINAADTINTSDYGNILSGSSGTNFPMLLLPLGEIEVDGDTSVTFTIDTTNIVSVYDNGTANDKTDDVPVLKNGFWNNFSVSRTE